ncbi:MAG TPA: hypothetical protein VKV39_07190 [Candidatus Sulfotelmatobacter sp.]|nr:hypothetical protein [Candidatus Sulfotelmatobacter sp.]
MKRMLLCVLLLVPSLVPAQTRIRRQGTIIRMRMADCMESGRGFVSAMSGAPKNESVGQCPEYVLVADTVVYVISGKASEQLLPMAEVTRFRFQKNEMLIRIDDASRESHFRIKAMFLRPEWERNEKIEEAEANAIISRHLDPTAMRTR